MNTPPNRMLELDGYTYLGFFPWLFRSNKRCRVCHRTAVGFCVLIGRGDEYLLRMCEICGRLADQHMKKGLRRSITREERQRIIDADESPNTISYRLGVSLTAVHRIKQEARGAPLVTTIQPETKRLVMQDQGTVAEIARRHGVSTRSVSRIRSGK